jgi:predicted ATPase/Tfp pilus assembly protein PilF
MTRPSETSRGERASPEFSLRDLLDSDTPCPVGQAVNIAIRLAEKCREAGQASPAELRPEHVLLDRTSQLPRMIAAPGSRPAAGSPYLSPEVCRGEDPDVRSTVWSVGALLFEMLVGRPFSVGEPPGSEDSQDLLDARPEVPDELAALVYRTLDDDPDLRPQDLDEIRSGLKEILAALDGAGIESADASAHLLHSASLSGRVSSGRAEDQALLFAATPFVGREREIVELQALLADPQSRLITLVGPGGIGKSRLAFQVARAATGSFLDGVYFVPLSAVRSPTYVPLAVGNAMDFRFTGPLDPKVQLLRRLERREILLVLDDFDRLLQGAPLIRELLEGSEHVRIMITSRQRLNLRAEHVFEVGGLEVPDVGGDSDPLEHSAVRLFNEAARRVHPGFSLRQEQRHVVRICHVLEGTPLGIELAAGWVRVLPCSEIAGQIEGDVSFLATKERDVPERHRGMRATFDRSWALLTEEEQDVLSKLSVFRGGFTRDAARTVAGATLWVLSALVDNSLVRKDPFGRLQIHELLRQYLDERLASVPAAVVIVRDVHAEYYSLFLQEKREHILGVDQVAALDQIEQEIGNVQKAWDWAVERGLAESIARCIGALHSFFRVRGWFREGEEVFGRAGDFLGRRLRSTDGESGELADLAARILSRRAALSCLLGRYAQARGQLEESLRHFRLRGRQTDSGFALEVLGDVALNEGKLEEAEELYQESLTTARDTGDRRMEAASLVDLAQIAMKRGRYDESGELFSVSLAISREIQSPQLIAQCLNGLGNVAYFHGDSKGAGRLYEQALAAIEAVGDKSLIPIIVSNLGNTAAVLGDHARAKELYERSLEIRKETGSEDGIARSHYLLGHVCMSLGENEESEKHLRESLAILRRIGNKSAAATTLACLGNLMHHVGRLSEAEDFCNESLEIFEALGERWGVALSLAGLGQIAQAGGDTEKAWTLNRRALGVAAEIGAADHTLSVIRNCIRLLEAEGEVTRAAELFGFLSSHEPIPEALKRSGIKGIERLSAEPGGPEVEAAVARGKALTLDEVVEALLGPGVV